MKVLRLLFVFITLLTFSVSAQEIKIKWDQPLSLVKGADLGLLGTNFSDRTFYFLEQQDFSFYLRKYDSNNKEVFRRELKFSQLQNIKNQVFHVMDYIMLRDRFVLLMMVMDRKGTTAKLFLQDVSMDGEMTDNLSDVIEANSSLKCSFHLSVSPDSSKLAFSMAIPKQKGIDQNSIKVSVYDSKMELLGTREASYLKDVNGNSKLIKIETALLNNNGDLYFSGWSRAKSIYNDCLLWYLTKETNSLTPINTTSIGKKMKEYKLFMNTLGEPVLMGLYAEPGTQSHVYSGYFYGRINESNRLIDIITNTIPDSVQHPPRSAEAYNFQWKIHNKEDGGLVFVGECTWKKGHNSHFGNVLVLNIDHSGSLRYSTCVYKNQAKYMNVLQTSSFLNYYSCLSEYDNDRSALRIYFNDNPENSQTSNNKINAVLANISRNILVAVEVDQVGKVTKRPVAEPDDHDIIFCNGLAVKLIKGELIVMGLKEKELWLGMIKDEK